MQFIKKVASNTVFQIFARIVTSGTSFAVAILIARFFNVVGYGDFAKITAFVTIFYLISDFGFNAIFLQQDDAKFRFKDLLYLRIAIAIGLIIVVNSIAATLPFSTESGIGYSPLVKSGILLYSLTLITESILYSSGVIFQQKLTYKYQLYSGAIGSLVTLGSVALFGFLHLSFIYIILAFVIGGIAESGSSLFYTQEKLLPARIDIKFAGNLVTKTLPMAILLIFNLIYFRIDMILLSFLRPTSDVAFYDLAYRVFDFLIALPLFLSNVIYPKLISQEKNNRNTNPKVWNYLAVFFVFGLVVAIPVWVLSPLLSLVKFDFLAAAVPLRILLVSLPIFFVTSIMQWIFIAKKKLSFLLLVYGFMLIVNVLLNLMFIPRFGYVASATITDVLEVAVLMLFIFKAQKEKAL